MKGALAAVLVMAGLLAGAVSADAASAQRPRALVRHLVCHQALDQTLRYVEITAVMRPVPGTRHMQMRFVLLRRPTVAGVFRPILGGGLGMWVSPPDPTLGQNAGDRWLVRREVWGLPTGTYRFRVGFRWIGAGGQVLRKVERVSRDCPQTEATASD